MSSSQNLITCPSCQHQFTFADLEKHELVQMREKLQSELKADAEKRALVWANDQIKKAEVVAQELQKKQNIELESLRKRDEEARKKEADFLKQQNEFEMLRKNLEIEKDKARIEERKKMENEFTRQAQEKLKIELEKHNLESEKQLRAKDEQIEQMKRSIEDAKRKWDQNSMQIQGELQENALKEMLVSNFPFDAISDVEKGIKWADLVQEIRNEFWQSIGIIAWESKNTKAWSDGWIDKMREDRLRVGADVSVIVSSALPQGIKHFGIYRDIWVTSYDAVLPLTAAIRTHMGELMKTRNSLKWKDEKMEIIYNYLISSEFKAKIENIVEAFSTMKNDLDRERRAMEKIWSAREKQLTHVIDNTSRLYGDMQWLIGSKLGTVEHLELTMPWED